MHGPTGRMKHSSRRSFQYSTPTINCVPGSRRWERGSADRAVQPAGLEAGRRLGYKIRTTASDPEQRGHLLFWVVVIDSSSGDEDRIRE
jgi:hypothetical protein